jgi:hypothetical protein
VVTTPAEVEPAPRAVIESWTFIGALISKFRSSWVPVTTCEPPTLGRRHRGPFAAGAEEGLHAFPSLAIIRGEFAADEAIYVFLAPLENLLAQSFRNNIGEIFW